MDAHIYLKDGEFRISLRIAGLEVDEAGPFDDATEALFAAERSVYDGGDVFMPSNTADKSDYMMGEGYAPGMVAA